MARVRKSSQRLSMGLTVPRIYYFFVAMNGCSAILLYIFYHPPNFGMKHGSNRQWEFIKNFDYVGTFLVTAGLLLFIMGISWGGDSVYPWKSAAVISTMIIGFFLLVAFFAWEILADLKEPLLPLGLFKNQCWLVSVLLWGTGSALYYSCAILWPAMVSTLYGPGHSWVRNGFVASLQGSGIILGEWTSACFKRYTEWQLRVLFVLVGILLACKISIHHWLIAWYMLINYRYEDLYTRYICTSLCFDVLCLILHRMV